MRKLQLAVKRLLDIVLCVIVVVLGWPVFALIAFLVKRSSPGPVFFVQERAGLNRKAFSMIKFRTMQGRTSDEPVVVWTTAEDARITPVGW